MKYLLENLHETKAADLQATKTTSAELLDVMSRSTKGGNGTKVSLLDKCETWQNRNILVNG